MSWDIMLPPDTVGFVLYVIATLVSYLLFHFYNNPSTNGSNTSRSSPSKRKASPKGTLLKNSGKTEAYAPVTGNRSANNVLASGRLNMLSKQQKISLPSRNRVKILVRYDSICLYNIFWLEF